MTHAHTKSVTPSEERGAMEISTGKGQTPWKPNGNAVSTHSGPTSGATQLRAGSMPQKRIAVRFSGPWDGNQLLGGLAGRHGNFHGKGPNPMETQWKCGFHALRPHLGANTG